MLKCSTSLWSADLGNLGADMKRVEPYSEQFHLDVADGHYVKTLLFFPDLVKTLRPHTRVPFEIHVMVTDPLGWVEPFIEAGADSYIFCFDSAKNPGEVIRAVKSMGKRVGVSLLLDEPLDLLKPYWEQLDILTIVGTAMGIKGRVDGCVRPSKNYAAREIISKRGLNIDIEADGGIRRETVPLLKAAGVDYIVPGSLMFKEEPAQMRKWLASL